MLQGKEKHTQSEGEEMKEEESIPLEERLRSIQKILGDCIITLVVSNKTMKINSIVTKEGLDDEETEEDIGDEFPELNVEDKATYFG